MVKILLILLLGGSLGFGRDKAAYATETNLSYYDPAALETATDDQKEQCRLDVYHPVERTGSPVVIWFHGGGLTGGSRGFPALQDQGFTLVAASYRLSPQGEFPCFLEDAAAATAWTVRHIAEYGGDPEKIFVSGHSAGGYLALMIGLDPKWLARHGVSNRSLAGLIPVSAQVTTHFQVKKLRGDTGEALRPLIDEFAPLYHASKDLPPICLITGDRKIEYKCRVEENDLFAVTLKNLGHPNVEFHELPGLDHNTVGKGSAPLFAPFIAKITSQP